MKIFKLSLVACLLISCFACEKEDTETAQVFFSGITNRDGNGNENGNVDPDDWNLNVTFNAQERALFPADNLPICTDALDTVYSVYVYPNPCSGIFVFGSIIQMDRIALRIVDDNYNVLFAQDSLTSPSLSINEQGDGGSRMVRMYYSVYNDTCKYQGYGDISLR